MGPHAERTKHENECEEGIKDIVCNGPTRNHGVTNKEQKKIHEPIFEGRPVTQLAILERVVRQPHGYAQPKPQERNQGSEGVGGAAVGFDPLVKTGFNSEKVADGGGHQVHHERGRADLECIVCVEERQLPAGDGRQR